MPARPVLTLVEMGLQSIQRRDAVSWVSAGVLREGVDLVKVAAYGLGVVVFLSVAANQHISIALGHIP